MAKTILSLQNFCLSICFLICLSTNLFHSFGVWAHHSGQLQKKEPEGKWNKQRESKPNKASGLGRCAGSGAHKELSVRVVVLHIPVEYSLNPACTNLGVSTLAYGIKAKPLNLSDGFNCVCSS